MIKTARLILLCIFTVFVCVTKLNSQSFAFSASGGYSYRFMLAPARSDNSYSTYFDRKREGNNLNFDLIWIQDVYGLGIGFNRYFNSSSGKNVQLAQFNKVNVHENIRVDYFNLQFHRFKNFSLTRFSLDFEVGMGLVKYYNDSTVYSEKIEIEGKTYGLHGSVSLLYKISKQFTIDLKPKLFMAVLSEETKDGYFFKLNPKEGLTRFDINLGIRLYF
jgi:hypothetical protein